MSKRPRRFSIEEELAKAMRKQRKAFIKKFGREPGPGDLVNFDPDAPGDDPVPYPTEKMRREVLDAMRKADLPPHLVYAYAKTGLILSEDRRHTYDPAVAAEYDAAIEEYFALEAAKKGD